MIKSFSAFIIIFLFNLAHAQMEMDILGNPSSLTFSNEELIKENCSNCTPVSVGQCPPMANEFIKNTLTPTIYSFVVGAKMADICWAHKHPMTLSPERADQLLATAYKDSLKIPQQKLLSCLEQNKVKVSANGAEIKLVSAYLHGLNKNIIDLQKEKIAELASADALLGQPVLGDIICNGELKGVCEEQKKCKSSEDLDAVIDYSMASIKELASLDRQGRELRISRTNFGGSKLTPVEYAEIFDDLKKKSEYVKKMTPWLEGDIVRPQVLKLMKLFNEGKGEEVRKIFKTKMIEQLKITRDLQKKEFYKLKSTESCLVKNEDCSSDIVKNANAYYVKAYDDIGFYPNVTKTENTEVNLLKHAGSCVANLNADKKGMEEVNMMVASTGVGLLTGGLGGVLKLGHAATTFYAAGSRLKGIGSMAVLGAEAKVASDTFQSLGENCSRSLNAIKTEQGEKENSCTARAKNSSKVSQLKSCIVGVAMTTLPYAFSFRGMKSGAKAETAEMIKAEVDDLTKLITNPLIKSSERVEIAQSLQKLNLSPEELKDVLQKMNAVVKNDLDKNRLKNYIHFVNSLSPSEQKLAINQLHDIALLSSNISPGSYVQKFYLKENKFYLYEKFQEKVLKGQLLKKGNNEETASKVSQILAREKRAALQKKFYACQSKTVTPEHKVAAKRFVGMSVVLGVGGTAYGYASANKDKFENQKTEWVSKLGYDIAMTFLMTKLSASIIKSPSSSLGTKYIQSNLSSAAAGGLDATVYSKLYGVTEEEAKIRFEEIKNSPDAQKELKMLDDYFEKTNLAGQFKKNINDAYKKIVNSPDKESLLGKPPYQIGDTSFSSLSAEDLEKPEVKEKIIIELMKQMNSGENGPLFSTGDKGGDRWVTDRVWNAAVGVPKGLIIGAGMYQILCLGIDKPLASLSTVTGLQFANQFLSSDAYYEYRKKMIGQ